MNIPALSSLWIPKSSEEERLRQALVTQSKRFLLEGSPEIDGLMSRVNTYVSDGNEKLLEYLICQVNPNLRVRFNGGVLVHWENKLALPVLYASTVFDHHDFNLRIKTSQIQVEGREVRFYDRRKKHLATFKSWDTIPNRLLDQRELPPALQLIQDFTGLVIPPSDPPRMERVLLERKGEDWTYKIQG